jgi:hypothetical protein
MVQFFGGFESAIYILRKESITYEVWSRIPLAWFVCSTSKRSNKMDWSILVFLTIGSSFGIGGYTIKIYSLCEHLTSDPVALTRLLSKRNSDWHDIP